MNIRGKKVWLIETESIDLLRTIFSLFHLTKSSRVHQSFYCIEQTNWTKMRAFLYRCFYSKTLEILIWPHLSSSEIQDHFALLLHEFLELHPGHYFSLGLISASTVQNVQLINTLKVFNLISKLREQDLLNKIELCYVTSRLTVLGKTSWIKEQAGRAGKDLIKFPIEGEVHADHLAKGLTSLTKYFSTSALHIDIKSIHNLWTLDEILYSLTLFLRFGQNAISLPSDMPIFIELDSSP